MGITDENGPKNAFCVRALYVVFQLCDVHEWRIGWIHLHIISVAVVEPYIRVGI